MNYFLNNLEFNRIDIFFFCFQVDQEETIEITKPQPKKSESSGTRTKSKTTTETKKETKPIGTNNLVKENKDYDLLLNIENEEQIKIPKGRVFRLGTELYLNKIVCIIFFIIKRYWRKCSCIKTNAS